MIKFHGVFIDPRAVIGIGEIKMESQKFYFEVHLPGSLMRVTVLDAQHAKDLDEYKYQEQLAIREQEKFYEEIQKYTTTSLT